MPAFIRYFWFICAAFMIANLLVWRHRLTEVVSSGVATSTEADRFLRGAAVWLVGAPCALGCIALLAGWSSPFCAGILTFDTPPRAITSGIIIVSWLALLWWVWRGSGADFLARVGASLSRRLDRGQRYSAGMVRLVITASVIVCAVVTPVFWRVNEVPSQLACPVLTSVGNEH